MVLWGIVRSDRAWTGTCPSASWWAAVIRTPWWCYGALTAITTSSIWGFLSTTKWRVSWWISSIAPWTISWIIIAAGPSTFIVTWVCWFTGTPYTSYTQVLARSRRPCSLPLCLHRKLETSVVFKKWHTHGITLPFTGHVIEPLSLCFIPQHPGQIYHCESRAIAPVHVWSNW